MKKTVKLITMGAIFIMMMAMMIGCSTGSGTAEGKLINANDETLVVRVDGEVEIFNTTNETKYDLAGEEEITAGDTLRIEYHEEGKEKLADSVTIIKAVNHTLKMTGELSDLNETNFTVTSDSLTVKFNYDAKTEVTGGKLNEGDEVRVTYKGDLSEEPHAISVDILQEQADDPHYEAHGIIADMSETTILLSIDSADAHRFIYNSETEIVSDDNKMEIGDRAEVTFVGDIDKKAVATKIVVHHQAKKNQRVINGTLTKAEKTYLMLDTGRNEYKILVNDKTQFTGGKYQKGVKATITYKGDLEEEPLATDVYCDKAKKKDDPTKTKTTETKPTETKTETQTETQTETEPPKPPTPVTVTVKAYIEEWDMENNKGVFKVEDDEETPLELTIKDVDLPVGYFPQVGDYVLIEYDKDKMDLMDMQLIESPDPDPEQTPDRNESESQPAETEAETTTKAPTTTTKAPTTAKETTAAPETEAQDNGGDDE